VLIRKETAYFLRYFSYTEPLAVIRQNTMKKLSHILLLTIFVSISCKTEKSNHQSSNKKIIVSEEHKKIDSLFKEIHDKDNFNGNVLISKKGEIIFKKSYGFAKYEEIALSDNSIFNLASITKQFTASAIVLLERENKLNYEDDIRLYLPELNFYPKITIRNLLNHTSGLYDYMKLTDSLIIQKNNKILLNNDNVIDLYKTNKPKLNFLPNEKYEYSNTGYLLLATIIERVSKESYSNFLKNQIFQPLKMEDTKVLFRYINSKNIENLTIGYEENENGKLVDAIETTPQIYNYDGVKGQGRLYSTTLDLNKWSNALSDNFFSKTELKEISAISKTTENEQVNYGFGWYITNDIVNGKSIYHSGSWPGYVTYLEKNLKHDITVIILQNVSTKRTGIPTYPLRNILFEKKELVLEESYLKSLAGEYEMSDGRTKQVVYKNNKLYAVVNPSFQLELIPITKTIFEVNEFSPKVNFEFILESNSVRGYKFYQLDLGKEVELTRIE
jgi:CubicO group peptidase (beta-lactamase class C family)